MSSSISPVPSHKKTEFLPKIQENQTEVYTGEAIKKIWDFAAPYLIPVFAASAAIIPPFYGFVAKSAQQIGEPIPRMTFRQVFLSGLKAAPTIGMIVGTQMGAQKIIENTIGANQNNRDNIFIKLGSSLALGAISAPLLAAFNRQPSEKLWCLRFVV